LNALAVADSPALVADESGLMRRFLQWTTRAYPHERAAAVNALARAYLHCALPAEARADAEAALTRMLDDPEIIVRRALAEAFAGAHEAPRHIVLALAADVSPVARIVLAQSPLLGVADLVDCVGYGDAVAQGAIARRARVPAPVAAALAEVGERGAALALIGNLGAELGKATLWRLFERFCNDAELRARLIERPGLPPALRAAIAAATTADISGFAAQARWMEPRRAERLARDGREQAFVAIAAECDGADLAELVGWLRSAGHLTVALLLRGLAGGDAALFAQCLADMADMPPARAAALAREPRGQGFAALYARSGLPAHLFPAFRIAADCARGAKAGAAIDYALTTRMLRAVEALADPALAPVAAMLWRLAGEGARDDAREFAAHALSPEAAIQAQAEVEDFEIEAQAPAVLMLNVEPSNENFAPLVELERELTAPVAA
jgi:uncharacterized protein (DUF2336 family)